MFKHYHPPTTFKIWHSKTHDSILRKIENLNIDKRMDGQTIRKSVVISLELQGFKN